MKIFLDTADIAQIAAWKESGLIDGVTTNPTHLSKAGSPIETIKKIVALLPHGDISVEVTEKSPQDVYAQALAIAKLGKNIVVKIPADPIYFSVIAKLVKEKVRLNITLIFSLMQGVCMAKLGVAYISPFVGRLDDIKEDGAMLVSDLRQALDEYGYQTQILAASLRNNKQVHDVIMAGADVITLPPALLAEITNHPLTVAGIKKFDDDWQKVGESRWLL